MSWKTISLIGQLGENIGLIPDAIKRKKLLEEKARQKELLRQVLMPYFKKKIIPQYPEEKENITKALSQLDPSQWKYLSLLIPKEKKEPKKVIYEYRGLSKKTPFGKSTKEKELTKYEKWKKEYDKALGRYQKAKQSFTFSSDDADTKKLLKTLKEKVAYWERKGVEKGFLTPEAMEFSNLKYKYLPQNKKEILKQKIKELQKKATKSSNKTAEKIFQKWGF